MTTVRRRSPQPDDGYHRPGTLPLVVATRPIRVAIPEIPVATVYNYKGYVGRLALEFFHLYGSLNT